nr:odorant receptor 12 [Achelura yunnanensis]
MTKNIVSTLCSGGMEFFELAFILSPYIVVNYGLIKGLMLVKHKVGIEQIIAQISEQWRNDDDLSKQQKYKKKALLKSLNWGNTTFYWITSLSTIQYLFTPLIKKMICDFKGIEDCEWLLPFACSYPIDMSTNLFVYGFLYVHQVYWAIIGISMYQGVELLLYALCGHLSSQFVLLQEDLLHVNVNKKSAANDRSGHLTLHDIIKKHQLLTGFSKELDNIFNKIIFGNMFFATITIGMFGFVAKFSHGLSDMLNNFVGATASIIPIYNLCYYAQLLSDSSGDIADAAYKNHWWKSDRAFRTCICIIIARAQKPCFLTSLGYAPVTLNTFARVLSNTWSYFSLMISAYEEK